MRKVEDNDFGSCSYSTMVGDDSSTLGFFLASMNEQDRLSRFLIPERPAKDSISGSYERHRDGIRT